MPITYGTFLVAAVAISGIPPLSGFFSKDEILWYSFTNLGIVFWLIGLITALMTAFYMFRLYFMTFEGKEKFDHHKLHPHESPKLMTVPLIVLAVLSAIGGFIGIPEIFSGEHGNLFHSWLAPVFKTSEIKLMQGGGHSHLEEVVLMIISVVAAASAIFFARKIYLNKPEIADKTSSKFKGVYSILLNKYKLDEVYEATIVNPLVKGSENILWKIADNKLIDGLINGLAKLIDRISGSIKKIQTGVAQSYALVMVLGILIALFWIILSYS
jgi:NADH-quinone oxidoreductase subunit L